MQRFYQFIKPLLFRLEPEQAHTLTTQFLDRACMLPGSKLFTNFLYVTSPYLRSNVCGIDFANPVGLAAGFDKNGSHIRSMACLGFGFLELGTITPKPQLGNEQPRLFRLPEDQALINRMGFNNHGYAALRENIYPYREQRPVPLGINLGKNKITPNEQAAEDYIQGVYQLGPYADYLVVNISSPNTPGLRQLSQREPLLELLHAVQTARRGLANMTKEPAPPLWLKISPDETPANLDTIIEVAQAVQIDGLIATNTTVTRTNLRSAQSHETGGLSGAPLLERSNAVLSYLYRATQGSLPLIGVGGIQNGAQAYARICAGASLIQLYTGLIYGGPTLIRDINRSLIEHLKHDGHTHISSAIGSHATQYQQW